MFFDAHKQAAETRPYWKSITPLLHCEMSVVVDAVRVDHA